MKRIEFLYTFMVSPFAASVAYCGKAQPAGPAITFYKPSLVCNAAQTICCGSGAKPALLEMDPPPAELYQQKSTKDVRKMLLYRPQFNKRLLP